MCLQSHKIGCTDKICQLVSYVCNSKQVVYVNGLECSPSQQKVNITMHMYVVMFTL